MCENKQSGVKISEGEVQLEEGQIPSMRSGRASNNLSGIEPRHVESCQVNDESCLSNFGLMEISRHRDQESKRYSPGPDTPDELSGDSLEQGTICDN